MDLRIRYEFLPLEKRIVLGADLYEVNALARVMRHRWYRVIRKWFYCPLSTVLDG